MPFWAGSPPLRKPKQRNMGEFNYKEQYGVIVICDDEKQQQKVYERLLAEGYKLKVVTV